MHGVLDAVLAYTQCKLIQCARWRRIVACGCIPISAFISNSPPCHDTRWAVAMATTAVANLQAADSSLHCRPLPPSLAVPPSGLRSAHDYKINYEKRRSSVFKRVRIGSRNMIHVQCTL